MSRVFTPGAYVSYEINQTIIEFRAQMLHKTETYLLIRVLTSTDV